MVRFDAYTATTTAANCYQLTELFGPGLKVKEARGVHQFGHRLLLSDDSGTAIGTVQWGGRQGDRSMLEVKGERSPAVAEALRSLCAHRVTRVDACADFDAPRAFDGLLRAFQKAKREHGIWGERRGDWDDHPEKGRTFYLGANTSPTKARLYEKGLQPEYAHLGKTDWVRAEVQVRPEKDAKAAYSALSPVDVWGAARWSRDLAGAILKNHVDPHPAGSVYRKTDLERRVDWICRQGGPTLLELLDACGSWACVGLTLGERVKELSEK
jgi:DNA relaxase NicK